MKDEKDLEKALDESLDALTKAAADENILKAESDADAEEEPKPEPEEMKGEEKDEEKEEEKKEDEDMKGDEKKDEEDEAMKGGYQKSVENDLTKSETVSNAIEVSKFLRDLTKSLSEVVGDLKHRVVKLEKSNRALTDALVKANEAQVSVIKSMGEDISHFGGRPLPRKSVENSKVPTIEKGFRNNEEGESLSKGQVAERLAALEMESKVPIGTTTRFEMTGDLQKSFEKLVYESDSK